MRPRLVLVTGAPGSGKTTLGRALAAELRVPFLARDDVRGGLLFTAGAWTDRLDHVPAGDVAVERFLTIVETMLAAGVSCVVEYVVRSSRPVDLDRLVDAGDLVVIRTVAADTDARLRRRNSMDRLIANPAVLHALGLDSVAEHTEAMIERMRAVELDMRTEFPVPTLDVATDDAHDDAAAIDLASIVEFVTGADGVVS